MLLGNPSLAAKLIRQIHQCACLMQPLQMFDGRAVRKRTKAHRVVGFWVSDNMTWGLFGAPIAVLCVPKAWSRAASRQQWNFAIG